VKIVDLNNSLFEVVQVYDPIPSGIKTHLKQRKRGRKEEAKEYVRGDVKRKQKARQKRQAIFVLCLASRSIDVIFIS
jgi:hypothetical protein